LQITRKRSSSIRPCRAYNNRGLSYEVLGRRAEAIAVSAGAIDRLGRPGQQRNSSAVRFLDACGQILLKSGPAIRSSVLRCFWDTDRLLAVSMSALERISDEICSP